MRCKCVKLTLCQKSALGRGRAATKIFHAGQPRRGAVGELESCKLESC